MLPENQRMQDFLKKNGINARVKRIDKGSLKKTWRFYDPAQKWTMELAEKMNKLGFKDFDGKPLGQYSGDGGLFSVFVRGHEELLEPKKVAKELIKIAKLLMADTETKTMLDAVFNIDQAIGNLGILANLLLKRKAGKEYHSIKTISNELHNTAYILEIMKHKLL